MACLEAGRQQAPVGSSDCPGAAIHLARVQIIRMLVSAYCSLTNNPSFANDFGMMSSPAGPSPCHHAHHLLARSTWSH